MGLFSKVHESPLRGEIFFQFQATYKLVYPCIELKYY